MIAERGNAPAPPNAADAQGRAASIWSLRHLSLTALFVRVVAKCNADDVFERASGLAFNFVLALFPLLLFLIALFGAFASQSMAFQNRLLYYFGGLAPPAALELLRGVLAELAQHG